MKLATLRGPAVLPSFCVSLPRAKLRVQHVARETQKRRVRSCHLKASSSEQNPAVSQPKPGVNQQIPDTPSIPASDAVQATTSSGGPSSGGPSATSAISLPEHQQQPVLEEGQEATSQLAVEGAQGQQEELQPSTQKVKDASVVSSEHSQHGAEEDTLLSSELKTIWKRLLMRTVGKLGANLWPLLLVHMTCDALVFGLHRISHRVTNEAALRYLGGSITPEAIGNLWWLSTDPTIANFRTGYQLLTIIVFLVAFPLNVLLKSTAGIYSVYICDDDLGKSIQRPWWQPLSAARAALPILGQLQQRVGAVWKGVFAVELLVAAVLVPLQFASLAVVTLPITLPYILDLQAAGTAAVLEGVRGIAALKRSRQLMKPLRWRLAVPFVGIVLALRVLDAGKGFLLTTMPARYYRELVEIPVGIVVLGALGSVLLTRLQDVLPYVAYKEAAAQEVQQQHAAIEDAAPKETATAEAVTRAA